MSLRLLYQVRYAVVFLPACSRGGRTWWAHFEFTRINIELTILRKKIEENLEVL